MMVINLYLQIEWGEHFQIQTRKTRRYQQWTGVIRRQTSWSRRRYWDKGSWWCQISENVSSEESRQRLQNRKMSWGTELWVRFVVLSLPFIERKWEMAIWCFIKHSERFQHFFKPHTNYYLTVWKLTWLAFNPSLKNVIWSVWSL